MSASALEEVYQRSRKSEERFPHRAILFVGNEAYDAPTITVVQGLEELGFSVYVIGKSNINSWFCDQVIEDPAAVRFDFVLSNLHCGTRWSHYDRFGLHGRLKVLVDGDDNPKGWRTWREKHAHYRGKYAAPPPEHIARQEMQPYRWVEPLGDYEPDVVFVSQKRPDEPSNYLPFGVQRDYLRLAEGKSTGERSVDFANMSGNGSRRERLTAFLAGDRLPGKVHNAPAWGEAIVPKRLEEKWRRDRGPNVHGYRRWALFRDYFRLLNDTKTFIYPGVYDAPQWDSKRPWEAYAAGCLVLLEEPNVDVSQYPVTGLCPFAVYRSYAEMVDKCDYLFRNQEHLDNLRREAVAGALKYFTPMALARYFLDAIARQR